jgi:rare lipoprotein A
MLAKSMRKRYSISYRAFAAFLLISFSSISCTRKASLPDSTAQTGVASWYGHPFDGRLTANGEIYDMEQMTAAHRTLPFGTVLRVERLDNGKATEVRINDRGPFVKDRIIDLSHAAALAISMPGIANVRLHVIRTPPTRAADAFAVQVGAFSQRSQADQLRTRLEQKYRSATLIYRDRDRSWCVLVGLQPDVESANTLAVQLDKEAPPAFVVRVDSTQ